ncbi:oligopeptide/dipeptide ABC transporter ATP-binding protein, partial [Morganella morganii]
SELATIPGNPPNLLRLPTGCPFRPRCQYATDECARHEPPLQAFSQGRLRACFRTAEELA